MPGFEAGSSLVATADGLTAAAACFNAAWLLRERMPRETAPARRLAAFSLGLLNAGIAAEAAYAQTLFTAHRLDMATEPFFDAAPWLAARTGLLAGTLLITALILRRRAEG
jgi:hypothetical protein